MCFLSNHLFLSYHVIKLQERYKHLYFYHLALHKLAHNIYDDNPCICAFLIWLNSCFFISVITYRSVCLAISIFISPAVIISTQKYMRWHIASYIHAFVEKFILDLSGFVPFFWFHLAHNQHRIIYKYNIRCDCLACLSLPKQTNSEHNVSHNVRTYLGILPICSNTWNAFCGCLHMNKQTEIECVLQDSPSEKKIVNT